MEKTAPSASEKGSPLCFALLSRVILASAALREKVRKEEITGLIHEAAQTEKDLVLNHAYDSSVRQWSLKGRSVPQILDHLLMEDARAAADLLLPMFKHSEGEKGFVSLAMDPRLFADPAGILQEAQRLWKAVKHPNLLIQIPATAEGLAAMELCLVEGIGVHATMIFSAERMEDVADAYWRALQQRTQAGKKLHHVFALASFTPRPLEEKVDLLLEEKQAGLKGALKQLCRKLTGKTAQAIDCLARRRLHEKFSQEPFMHWSLNGARRLKLLTEESFRPPPEETQGSSGQPAPAFPEADCTPLKIWQASADSEKDPHHHGGARLEKASQVIGQLETLDISLSALSRQLEEQGLRSGSALQESLLAVIAEKREAVLLESRQNISFGPLEETFRGTLEALSRAQFGRRLWSLDPTLWKAEDPVHQEEIGKRLGWLKVVEWMQPQIEGINQFVDRVRRAGFTHALLCGMGGSTLAPEVLRETFGITKGYLDLTVLDSTDPAAVLAAGARSNLETTLFIISTKSASTVETSAFFQYFWEKIRTLKGLRAGENFIAITDPGTAMEQAARKCQFRQVFLNPPDIGGRYAALSFTGMVPAALMGVNIARLLERAKRLSMACSPWIGPVHNAALTLGALIGTAAMAGRDKLTLILSEKISSFGNWVEQILADSTGKDGRGVIPIEGEPLGNAELYGKDRLFVYLRIGSKLDKHVNALIKAGHPVVTLQLEDGFDLGAEFLRWEIATATACWILQVNPFDQPNVQEAKDITREILTEYAHKGRIPIVPGAVSPRDVRFQHLLARHLHAVKKGDYVALVAFFERNLRRVKLFQEIRVALRQLTKAPTTVGFGPRYLHTTGQLHKGGTNSGVFIQFCAYDNMEAEVPGTQYSFDKLITAQAMGDYAALEGRHRRILLVDLEKDVEGGLRKTLSAISALVSKSTRKSARPGPAR